MAVDSFIERAELGLGSARDGGQPDPIRAHIHLQELDARPREAERAQPSANRNLASQKLQRHIGAIWQMLLPWALGTTAPAGVDRAKWAVTLEQSVRQLFPVS